jgi:hypothetical protein
MANNLAGTPYIIDTASASPIKSGRVLTTGFVYRDYAAAGNQAIIKDGVRNIIIARLIGNASLTPVGEAWFDPQWVQSLTVSQLDGGGILEIIAK